MNNLKLMITVFICGLMLAACGGGGSSASTGGSATTPTIVGKFAYVVNFSSNTISMYTVDSNTGQPRHNGYIAAGTGPISVNVDPSGKFAYVANQFSNDVSAYTINQTTGALTSVGAGIAAGSTPRSVTVSGSIQ